MGALFGTSIDARTLRPLTDDGLILRQWIQLILETQIGVYWSAPECGGSLRTYVLRGLTPDALAAIPVETRAAFLEDERIADADVTAVSTFTGGGGAAVKLAIKITPKGAVGLPYFLTAVASADLVTVILQGQQQEQGA